MVRASKVHKTVFVDGKRKYACCAKYDAKDGRWTDDDEKVTCSYCKKNGQLPKVENLQGKKDYTHSSNGRRDTESGAVVETPAPISSADNSGLQKWKCPCCKRMRKWSGFLVMKVCHVCQIEMEVVEEW